MKRAVLIAPDAETDILKAFDWYEGRSIGLGFAFLHMLERKIVLLGDSPQLFRKRFGPYRLAATKRFPYAIYFIWNETSDIITIRRVLHFKQNSRLHSG